MKNHKTLIAFIVLLLLLGVYIGITLTSSILSYMKVSSQAQLKIDGMVDTLNRVQENIDALSESFREQTENSIELMRIALSPSIQEDTYEGPEIFNDGVVVRIKDGQIIYPNGFSGRFELLNEAADLTGLEDMSLTTLSERADSSRPVLITARQIKGNFYYIDWWEMDDYQSSINYDKPIRDAVLPLEQLYDASLILYEENEEGLSILYASKNLGLPPKIEDFGSTWGEIKSEKGSLTINKRTYSAAYEELRAYDRSAKAVILLNPIGADSYILNCIIISVAFILVCMSALILWLHWIDGYRKDHELTEHQQKAWQISKLRKTAAAVGINGAILLFVLLIGYQLLGNLSRISNSNQESLDIMMARLENNSKEIASLKGEAESWMLYYAERVGTLYSQIPGCRDENFLKKANELIGSEYIMIFDGQGKELLSSNGYVGLTLGDGINTNEDFRYLLQGVEQIVCEPETEKFSGKLLQMAGRRMDLGQKDSYGAVLIVIDPQSAWETAVTKDFEDYLALLTRQENLSFVIDRNSGKVIYSSEPDLLNKTPADFGMDKADLHPVSLDTFEVLGIKKYGAFNEDEQYQCFFMTDGNSIWGDSVKFAVFSGVYSLLVCLVISLILLGFSSSTLTLETENFKEKLNPKSAYSIGQEALSTFKADERGDRSFKEWWHDLTPEQKISQLLKVVLTLLLAGLIIFLLNKGEFSGQSVISFVFRGNWKRGFNELSIMAIICSLVSLLVFILFKALLVRSLSSLLDAKGKTIVGLVSSLLQYIAIIYTIFLCLSYLGIDTSVLITSASILTLAISLGSKDLVADILSGIFIVFEGDFHVGDIIEVNGFKGKVIDIGVRSTKLKDSGNNIKIIDNQSVKNILNMSKENSWLFITLTLLNNEHLNEIEDMLNRELPKIGEKVPEITSGPYYFGISEIGYRYVKVTVGAMCQQADINKIKAPVNHYINQLFRENGFRL